MSNNKTHDPVAAVVTTITPTSVAVRYGDGLTEVEYLMGMARPKFPVRIGDRGTLKYVSSGSVGFYSFDRRRSERR
jgi:23S rRNA C2498 (ribose-2'-O)-methylase RlmM